MNYNEAKQAASYNYHRLPCGTMGVDYRPADRVAVVRVANEPYPRTAQECLDDSIKYKRGVISLLREFAADRPWRGSKRERFDKFAALHVGLCELYGIFPALVARGITGGDSGSSSFAPVGNCITLRGKFSVVTYLHEFAHALGKGERGAVRWSLNLFKRVFPRHFEAAFANARGHVVRAS